MFDMSWGEIMVIGGVALIVIGPKDLPKALRTVGQMTAKVRRMAGEFQSQFSEAMREAELEDVKKEMEGLNRDVSSAASGVSTFNPIQTIRDELKGAVESNPTKSAGTGDWSAVPPPADPPQDVSIDSDPAKAAGTGEWTPLPEPPAAPLVDQATLNPDTAAPDMIDPEVQPLVPLPADEAPLPTPEPVASGDVEHKAEPDTAEPREKRA
ncbi:Sec-independent protein translocase protein TatB [Enterovirga rhinocerotis]|uniref:Sec-independent protein translocase protein TatB n=1 Tax=Enterovirga rhinocerotis TaxID=1339210 RepID=A0A4R7C5T0_9HYPH|nr:Sec-independent protein translocase protein TatB [Enterovirga rhinocerotis]TDR93571.1 sec-independent protein translocase protein TatB [Enterovirga rhinocerotis]